MFEPQHNSPVINSTERCAKRTQVVQKDSTIAGENGIYSTTMGPREALTGE
jgi:hypothetical protein